MTSHPFISLPSSGVSVHLTVNKGHGSSLAEVPHTIDEVSGNIILPNDVSNYQAPGLTSRADLKKNVHELVTSFWPAVTWKCDGDTIVLQREGGDLYRAPHGVMRDGNQCQANFSPALVQTRIRNDAEMKATGLPRIAAWLQSSQKEGQGNNRADVWRIFFDDEVKEWVVRHVRILVLTLNDGKDFKVVEEIGWEGCLHQRDTAIKQYFLSKEPDATNPKDKFWSLQKVLDDPVAHDIMRNYVFVPMRGYENFEQRLQVLLTPEFQDLIRSATPSVRKNKEGDRFWTKPVAEVDLRPKQGLVEFFVYGLADGSMGMATLPTPMAFNGRSVSKVQLRHWSIDGTIDNPQGLKNIRPGDIVQIEKLVEAGKDYPPIAMCRIIYERLQA